MPTGNNSDEAMYMVKTEIINRHCFRQLDEFRARQ